MSLFAAALALAPSVAHLARAGSPKMTGNPPSAVIVMSKFVQAIDARRYDDLNALLSPDLIEHDMNVTTHGSATLLDRVRRLLTKEPDVHLSLRRAVANGDICATMFNVTFTRDGKQVREFWIEMWRISQGRIMEHWES